MFPSSPLTCRLHVSGAACLGFFFNCKIKRLTAAEKGGVELRPVKGCLTGNVCFSCGIISVWGPEGLKHILIPLPEPMIQTHRGTRADSTPTGVT